MGNAGRWGQAVWAAPWLLFQAFPIADIVTTERSPAARVLAVIGLAAFTLAYLRVIAHLGRSRGLRPEFLAVLGLGVVLGLAYGPDWAGLMIYVSAAAAAGVVARRRPLHAVAG